PPLGIVALRDDVISGRIDTVVVGIVDMQGRLAGKRFHAQYFLDQVLEHGTEGCNYLLAVDVDMNTVDGYEMSSWERGYGDLTPANLYNTDYSLLGTARIEPLLRRIRNEMAGAGLVPESAKGECNLGQHEISFRYSDALSNADQHTIYKNGTKEIAAQ